MVANVDMSVHLFEYAFGEVFLVRGGGGGEGRGEGLSYQQEFKLFSYFVSMSSSRSNTGISNFQGWLENLQIFMTFFHADISLNPP